MIQILLLALLPLAMAQYGLQYGESNGYGKIEESHYPPQPYKFGYDVKDHYGSTLEQKEEGDSHGNKRGSYGYTDGHGIYRQVDYVADKNGFRAVIKTNEPGTSNEDPADVHIQSSAPKVEYRSEPSYKSQSQSYAAPSIQYSTLSHAPSLRSYESSGYGGSLSSLGGYGKSQSIPAVYYAKGY